MRLTQSDKQAFVRAVMNDVPSVDYQEKGRDLLQQYFLSTMPPKLRAVYDDPALRQHLATTWMVVADLSGRFYTSGDKPSAKVTAQVEALMLKHRQQRAREEELKATLRGTVDSVTTRKRLVEVLPEFEKYAPTVFVGATANLPAIANVVSAFVKAGWPKDRKVAVRKVAA